MTIPTINTPLDEKAALYAALVHTGQRYGDRPYFCHLEEAAAIAKRFGLPEKVRAAVWLHDTLEDTDVTEDEIRLHFGPEVLSLVQAVTDPPGKNRRERKARALPKVRAAGGYAIAVKLCDRLANSHAARLDSPQLFAMYSKEYPAFRRALHRKGEWAEMWAELDMLFGGGE